MPRTLSQTPAAVAARARRAAASASVVVETTSADPTPVLTVTAFDAEFTTRLDTLREHAVSCGRLDCGHLGKSDSLAVRRAVILYVAEGNGVTLDLSHETPEVAAVYGVLVAAGQARPVYTRRGRGYVAAAPGLALTLPDGETIRLTTQRIETFTAMLRGESATMIARARGRDIETIKSHAGYLRRETGAHDAVSALVAIVLAGRLTDRAMTVAAAE